MLQKIRSLFYSILYRLFSNNANYIGGHDALPTPLSREEEIAVVEAFIRGEEQARDILSERNLRLVVYIARRFDNTATPIEDLISIGSIGLIKAIEIFNLDKNIKLATYASRCIENEILMHLRKTSKMKSEVSLDEPLNSDADGNELLLSDILGTDEEIIMNDVERKLERQTMFYAINQLTPREKYIMECRFGLLKSIDHFDLSHNVRFSTYAVPMIAGEIRRHLRSHHALRISRSIRDTAYKAMQAKEAFVYEHNCEPNLQQIATMIESSVEEILFALEVIQDPMSLHEPIYGDSGDAVFLMD